MKHVSCREHGTWVQAPTKSNKSWTVIHASIFPISESGKRILARKHGQTNQYLNSHVSLILPGHCGDSPHSPSKSNQEANRGNLSEEGGKEERSASP
jgi:hypothetical protein